MCHPAAPYRKMRKVGKLGCVSPRQSSSKAYGCTPSSIRAAMACRASIGEGGREAGWSAGE